MARARLSMRANPRQYAEPPRGQSLPIPAPSMGMNTRDSVSALDPREARLVRNMVPDTGRLRIRKGKTQHQVVTGATSIGSMFTHEGVGTDVLVAAADGELWNVTGAPSALTSANYTLNTWSTAQFNDTTIGVNGTDTPWAFDGTTVGASGFTGSGLTIANLRTVHVAGIRLWFTEEGSADVWYGAVNAITGTLTKFQLSQETKGGYCVGIYAFGSNTVFVMSTGEVVAYQGDPGIDFAQVRTYRAPKPVGYDPGIDVAGDLVIMTTSGPLPFEAIAAGIAFDTTALQSWGKIAPSWAEDVGAYGTTAGWNGTFWQGLVILNIQMDATASKQWVFNTRTKAWSYFDGLDGYQFSELGGTLYFGDKASNKVWAYAGGTDDGDAIEATVRGGFTTPFAAQVNGQYTLARMNVQATGSVTAQIQVDVDYQEQGITASEVIVSSSGSGPWGSPWGSPWGTEGQPVLRWSSVKGFGRSVAIVAQFRSRADNLQYFGTDLVAAPAGIIG